MTTRHSKKPELPDQLIDPRSAPFAEPMFRGNLPHLYKPGCSYFVTFCLFDVAWPRKIARERALNKPLDLARSSEPRSSGSCLLKDPDVARLVEDALLFFQGDRYALSAWCVMPNHVHAVVTPYDGRSLLEILHSWKSFTAHRINTLLGRRGRVWQQESFDHLVRSPDSFEVFVTYTENNPVAAGLVSDPREWPFSSGRFRGSEGLPAGD